MNSFLPVLGSTITVNEYAQLIQAEAWRTAGRSPHTVPCKHTPGPGSPVHCAFRWERRKGLWEFLWVTSHGGCPGWTGRRQSPEEFTRPCSQSPGGGTASFPGGQAHCGRGSALPWTQACSPSASLVFLLVTKSLKQLMHILDFYIEHIERARPIIGLLLYTCAGPPRLSKQPQPSTPMPGAGPTPPLPGTLSTILPSHTTESLVWLVKFMKLESHDFYLCARLASAHVVCLRVSV